MAYTRIILHAGLSKTGSTSIQANCDRQRDLLAAHGAHYPQFVFQGSALDNHSIPLIASVSDDQGRYALGARARFGSDLSELMWSCRKQLWCLLEAGGDTLVLSSERVAGLAPEDMQQLGDMLGQATERLSVLLYLRSPFELLEGIMQERAKVGTTVSPLSVVGRNKQRCLRLRECFGESLQLVNYHRAQQEAGGLVAGFFRYCGVPSTALEGLNLKQRNQRMSSEAYLLLSAVNERFPRNRQAEHGVVRRPGDLRVLHALPGQPFRLPWDPGSEVYDACLAEYEWFQNELGQEFPSPPPSTRQELWGGPAREALVAALEAVESLPIRNFLHHYVRENDLFPD